MTWITQSRQRSIGLLLLITLVLSLSLVACGQQVNATGTSNAASNKPATQQQQYQPVQPAQSQPGNTNSANSTTTNLQDTDQQVQNVMSQLDGARHDANNSNAASSQDNGQQP